GVQVSARRQHYTRMLGLGYRLEGLVYLTKGDFAHALDAYMQSLTCFHAIGGLEDEAAIQTSLAESLEYVGDMQRSWQARYSALSLVSAVHDPLAAYRMLQGASLAALRAELPEVALHFQQSALESAQLTGRSPAVVTGYITRAAINKRLGESER